MKLNVDLRRLISAVKKMTSESSDFKLSLDYKTLSPIDKELSEGVEIELQEIDFDYGLASHEGRQILLYIKDHSFRDKIDLVLEDGSLGNKYHVSDCTTIKNYREHDEKRFDRYIITTNLSGVFDVSGTNQFTQKFREGKSQLNVCRNCLTRLNYKGYPSNKNAFDDFSLEEFFSVYSSFFRYLPNQSLSNYREDRYSSDWNVVSAEIKNERHFKCKGCSVDLSNHTDLLHVHHINGIKSDNDKKNLVLLCVDCHRKEPFHGHLAVPIEQTRIINSKRKKQGLLQISGWEKASGFADPTLDGLLPGLWWEKVCEFADPALDGLLKKCEKSHLPVPEIDYELLDDYDAVNAVLALAWFPSDKKICVTIRKDDHDVATQQRWNVWTMVEALDGFNEFHEQFY